MAFKQNGTVAFDKDLGITDTTTALSNQIVLTEGTSGTNNYFGAGVDIYGGKLYVRRYNTLLIYSYDLDGTNETVFYNGGISTQGGTLVCGNGYIYTEGATLDDVVILDLSGNVVNTFSFPVATTTNTRRYAVGYGKLAVADNAYNSYTGRVYLYDAVGNLIKTIENPENTTFDSFGESIFIANGKLIITAMDDDDGGINDGAYYIYDLWGNYISKRSYTNNDGTNGHLKVRAVGSGRIVSTVVDAGTTYTILIDDLDGNNIASILDPASIGQTQFGVGIGEGRIVVVPQYNSAVYVYDLNGNSITDFSITTYTPSILGYYSVIVKNGKIVFSDPFSDVTTTNDGVVYIYDTPHQTHYLDLLDGL
jgi:hypothetical protein